MLDDTRHHIGVFENDEDASLAYFDVLTNGVSIIEKYLFKNKGYIFKTKFGTYRSVIYIKNKQINITTFKTKSEAQEAIDTVFSCGAGKINGFRKTSKKLSEEKIRKLDILLDF